MSRRTIVCPHLGTNEKAPSPFFLFTGWQLCNMLCYTRQAWYTNCIFSWGRGTDWELREALFMSLDTYGPVTEQVERGKLLDLFSRSAQLAWSESEMTKWGLSATYFMFCLWGVLHDVTLHHVAAEGHGNQCSGHYISPGIQLWTGSSLERCHMFSTDT